jgi:lipopolysaccharide/colanic/teichoic acid biosynthesis glycosyltransferase
MTFDWHEISKRGLDVALALVALAVTLPLWIAAATVILVASPGPIFFVQRRLGRGERPFGLIKFRTMHPDRRPPAARRPPSDFVTVKDDPRIFRGGAWLRRWKLDELPQLLNVLAGSMSLVGPRPTVAADYARMTPRERRRAEVRPGITGLAQIHGGAGVLWPERLAWDLRYVERRSLWLDLLILAATAGLILRGRPPGEAISSDEWAEAA